jgi:hypothetical protein
MRRISVIVGAVTCTVASAAGAVAGSPGPAGATVSASASAQSIYNAALAYAATQDVHYVSSATQGTSVLKVDGHTGPTSGQQSLTVKNGKTSEKMTVKLIGTTGYLLGNAPALTQIIGVAAKQASTYANRWLSFPTGNQTLDQLVSGLRNKDVAAELKLSGPFTFGAPKMIAGQTPEAIVGSSTDSSGKKIPTTLYVESSAPHRPLLEVTDPGSGSTAINGSVAFSNWGQQTNVTKPAHAVSLLSLQPAG